MFRTLFVVGLGSLACEPPSDDARRDPGAPLSHNSLTSPSASASTLPNDSAAPVVKNGADLEPRRLTPTPLYVRIPGATSALDGREKYGDPLDVWLGQHELGRVLRTRLERDAAGSVRAVGFEIEMRDVKAQLPALVDELEKRGARGLRVEELREDDSAPRVFFPSPTNANPPQAEKAPKILESGRGIAEERPR